MAFQIGQPGVSAFMQSLLRDLDIVIQMGDRHFLPVNTQLNVMKNLLLGFEDVLLDGERKRQHGEKGANRWMDQLNDSFYDIEYLLNEIKMEKQQLQHGTTSQPSNNEVQYYDFSAGFHISKNIKNRLDLVIGILRMHTEEANRLELKRDAVQHDANWLVSQAMVRPKQGCFADELSIHGREDDKNKIIEMLLTEDGGERKRKRKFEVVCVVGMGGLGKTTLAQLVFHNERVKNIFAVRSWACVSDVFDVIKVIQNLIESAAENAEKGDGAANMPSGLSALQARLKKIINDQKFLIVLDDLWSANVLTELIGPFHSGAKGSKILVTTRLTEVAEDLGNREPYRLGRLEDAQCLKIFNHNAFGDEDGIDNDEDLMKMGKEIVKKCKGVPLVAKVIGSLLKREDEGKWKAVKDNDLWNLAYKDEDLHPGLRLSYFYLPPFLKRCFEYFALFPSDFKLKQAKPVRMWIAEGLIEVKEGTEPEEIGDQYYNDLKGRSLIQEDNKIHDMVHHLASIVCGSSFFRCSTGSSSSTSSLQSVMHAFIEDKLELLINFRKLRTLIYKGDLCEELFSSEWWRNLKVCASTHCLPDQPSSLSCDLKHLRYLQLEGHFRNETLPDSICTLTNLQILDLSGCWNLKNLPQDVGKLTNLRFLGLLRTHITDLPDSVFRLSKLRVLDLSFCEGVITLPNDVGNLQNLHKLMLYGCSMSSLPESVVNATNLRVLDISNSVTLPANIGKLTKLEELSCYGVGKEKGRGIDELRDMNRLQGYLEINNMENIESEEVALMANLRSKKHIENLKFVWKEFDADLTGRDGEMEERVMEGLEPNGAIKKLLYRNYVGHKLPSWMWTAPLHNLTYLRLYNLPALREMTGMEFKSLLLLQLHMCPVLREVSMTTAKLETLKVTACKELKAASLVILPLIWDDLERLECDYRHLDYFVQQLKSANASPCINLKWLRVSVGGDGGITSLPVGWPGMLPSLEILTLFDLPPTNFKLVSEEDESCSDAPAELLVSINIRNCPALVSLESLQLPPRLKALFISECPRLKNLPYGLHDLTSLEEIVFSNCPVLEIRPHHPLPPSLRYKVIYRCAKLEEQRVMEEREEWKGAFGLMNTIWLKGK